MISDNNDVDAYLLIDMDRLELLSFLVAGIIDGVEAYLTVKQKSPDRLQHRHLTGNWRFTMWFDNCKSEINLQDS